MSPRRLLVAVSAVQLAANLTGQVVALRRRRHFDVPFMTGSPEHVGRDSWWFGTAYSAPSYILAAQAYAIARLAAGPDDRARGMLRLIGTSMFPATSPSGSSGGCSRAAWSTRSRRRSSLVGFAGAIAMAVAGARPQAGR